MNQPHTVPNHVAIIPDGNRRWARKRGLAPQDGHVEGAKNFEILIKAALRRKIKCLSIWGSSMDNLLKRPISEKRALLKIYGDYFNRLISSPEIYENEVQINVIGRWEEQFPASLKKIIHSAIQKTRHFKKRMLNFMLAYSGLDDMLQAVENINKKYQKGVRITASMLKENLMTNSLPPVDYVIRTGGEPHNSNGFLMWDAADSQLYFAQENFPDFSEAEFEKALDDYAKRDRRYGK
jgi:undecaprenyl diphosphate synthase